MDEEIIDNTADEFDLAFGVAVGGEEPASEATDEKPDPVVDKKDDVVEPTPDVVDIVVPPVEDKKEEPAKVEVPKVELPKVDLEAERIASEAKAKERADEAAKLYAEAVAKEALSPEEQAALKEVETNFPDTAVALRAVERVAFTKAENAFNAKLKQIEERFEQKLGQLSTDFAPAIATAHTVARSAHEAEILKGHSDAFDILPKVEQWVDTQPSFLKTAYNAVLDKGSAPQIVELFNIFKKESGSVKGPPTSPTPEETAQKAAKDKKLQSLEGVRSRQAAQKGGIDEDDFESAFKAAANS